MLSKDQDSQFSFYSVESDIDITGVEKTVILPRTSTLESGDSLLRNMGYLVFTVSEQCQLRCIVIEAERGCVVLCVTENFMVGAVLNKSADITMVDEMMAHAASALEDYFEQLRAVSMKTVEEKIRKGGDGTPG